MKKVMMLLLAIVALIALPLICGGLEINMTNSQNQSTSSPVTLNVDLIVQFIVAYLLGKAGWKGGAKIFGK
jgi:biopolymer transport protein ExbD